MALRQSLRLPRAGVVGLSRRGVSTSTSANAAVKNPTLAEHDPELHGIIQNEKMRQRSGLELIASENFTSRAVMEALGSCLTNKYSEGKVGARYYGGNKYIDQIEGLCQQRCLDAFGLSSEQWGVNVQPLSGSPANMAVYTGLLRPHDRIMGLNLPDGGHLTHGYYTSMKDGTVKAISATSVFFESLPYYVDASTGLIDYDRLAETAAAYKPRLIICGGSAYARDLDYARFREIADDCGAYLHCDMAHISGLVAAGVLSSPFEYCDVVTSTTHKSLRGPRSGLIIARKDIMEPIDFAVFPMLQGGPHNHQIAALATQLKDVQSTEFKDYIKQVVANAQALAAALQAKGNRLATGGTDTHLLVWDMRPHGITGSKMELLCDAVNITLNKNTIHGDRNALNPGAVRIGTPALTTRGFKEADFETVGELLMKTVELAIRIQERTGKPLRAFREGISDDSEVSALRAEVNEFALRFDMPGV